MQYELTNRLDFTKPLETLARIVFDINDLLIVRRLLFFSCIWVNWCEKPLQRL